MYSKSNQNYKNKYTRELSKLLLVHLPPKNGKAYGLTGNLLPIIVLVKSSRKFNRMRGWYWTEYSVTNKYAKLTERMKLIPVDDNLITRMWYRYRTVNVEEVALRKIGYESKYEYVTVVSPKLNSLFLFYLNSEKKSLVGSLEDDVRAKKLVFRRFGKTIVNYVSDDIRIVKLFMERGVW